MRKPLYFGLVLAVILPFVRALHSKDSRVGGKGECASERYHVLSLSLNVCALARDSAFH
jgi:hypothetical protein